MEVVSIDNQEYILLDTIVLNGVKYLYLVEATDNKEKAICIRKLVDQETNMVTLDSEDELNQAFQAYITKYKNVFTN